MSFGGRSNAFVRLAMGAAVAYAVALPSLTLDRILASPIDPGKGVWAVPAFACLLAVELWLVVAALADRRGRWQLWGLAVLWVGVAGMVPVVGTGWLGMLIVPSALVLLFVRLPWSVLAVAAVVALQGPLAIVLGHPEWGLYFSLDIPLEALTLAVGIWLIRVIRQLQAARLALAEEAVVRERLRIDGELRETVGAALAAISRRAGRAAGSVGDPAVAERELVDVASASRRTLADVRRMVRRYRDVSLLGELESAVTLLSAAGIRAHVVLPPGGLPEAADEEQRAALRRGVAALLGDATIRASVVIAVTRDEGRLGLELRSS